MRVRGGRAALPGAGAAPARARAQRWSAAPGRAALEDIQQRCETLFTAFYTYVYK